MVNDKPTVYTTSSVYKEAGGGGGGGGGSYDDFFNIIDALKYNGTTQYNGYSINSMSCENILIHAKFLLKNKTSGSYRDFLIDFRSGYSNVLNFTYKPFNNECVLLCGGHTNTFTQDISVGYIDLVIDTNNKKIKVNDVERTFDIDNINSFDTLYLFPNDGNRQKTINDVGINSLNIYKNGTLVIDCQAYQRIIDSYIGLVNKTYANFITNSNLIQLNL